MKIKEVSLKTGLTEKAIRLYIENGLIHPHIEKGLHRNSYTFSDTDVNELDEISVLRKAGFSIFEISLIKEMPEKLPEILNKKMMSLETEIDEKKNIKDAISRLEVHELANVSKIADSLKPAIKNDEVIKESISKRFLYLTITFFIIGFFLLYVYLKGGLYTVKLTISFLSFLSGLFSGVMSIRYATCTKHANKLPNKATGTVISVVEEHGFNAAFSNAGSNGAGTKEPGIGGMWQIFFMLWNEIRPDCWFPVILYNKDDTKKESATLLYGSFKNIWHIGDEVPIAWNDEFPMMVYPTTHNWILTKVRFYILITIFSLTMFILFLML